MRFLIPEWRKAYRMLSVQFAALAVLWLALPETQQVKILTLLPWVSADQVAGLLILLGIVGRLVSQPKGRQ